MDESQTLTRRGMIAAMIGSLLASEVIAAPAAPAPASASNPPSHAFLAELEERTW